MIVSQQYPNKAGFLTVEDGGTENKKTHTHKSRKSPHAQSLDTYILEGFSILF